MKEVIYRAKDHTVEHAFLNKHNFEYWRVAEPSDVETALNKAKDFAHSHVSEFKNEFRTWEAEHGQVHEKLGRWGAEQAEALKSKLQEIEKKLGGAITDIQGYFELKTQVEQLGRQIDALREQNKKEFNDWIAEHGQEHERLGRWGAEQAEPLKSKLQEIEKKLGGAITDIQGYFELKTQVEKLGHEIGTLREQVTIDVPVSHEKAQQLCGELAEVKDRVSSLEKTLQAHATTGPTTPCPKDGRSYATVDQLNDVKINLEVGLQKLNDTIAEQPRPVAQRAPDPHDDAELRNQIKSLLAERERRVQQSASLWHRLHWLILGD